MNDLSVLISNDKTLRINSTLSREFETGILDRIKLCLITEKIYLLQASLRQFFGQNHRLNPLRITSLCSVIPEGEAKEKIQSQAMPDTHKKSAAFKQA